MDKQRIAKLMNSQIEYINKEIRDLEYEDYNHEDIHNTIDFFGEMKKLKGSRQTLITMRNIIENMED